MIYCIGDSFTYGEELADRNTAWPAILGKKLNQPVTNWGKPATGNHRMVKRTMDAVFAGASLIVVGWSDPARQEFADDISITDLWAGRDYRRMQTCTDHRRDLIKYMTAYDVPGYYYAQWIRQIVLTQTFCRANAVPCVMFSACNAESWNIDYIKKQSQHEHLTRHVDVDTYIGWPYSGSTEWTYGTPHGPGGHPLEQGHEIIAEKIYEHISRRV